MRVLVTEELSEHGLDLLRADFDVDVRPDLATGDLVGAIGDYEALVIRSATRVTAEVIAAADRLKVVARAGIGLDNVDIAAATARGVLVVNAPQSNVVSAAEHTMALLLAQARNVALADASLRAGRWERSRFQGTELLGKVLGVIGLGRVGVLVAQRAAAFGMKIVAFDPYVPKERGRELGVELVPTLEALLVQADVVTIHLPKTPDTEGLLGEREIALMKPGARLVNTSRGGLVDEAALAKAIEDGRLAGAAFDVFATEPPGDSPLLRLDEVVATPHLGASTSEAQDKAGTTVAEMVRLALLGEFVPFAVNLATGEVSETVRPFVPLAARLGRILVGLADGALRSIECRYEGRIAEGDVGVLTLAILKGAISGVVDEPVSFVNAPVLARERGLVVSETKSAVPTDYVNLVSVRGRTDAGEEVSVAGTLGARDAQRVLRVNGYDIEMAPASHMVFIAYEDRPGVIGTVGTILGEADVNIATMDVGRPSKGGTALMGLTLDSPVEPAVLARIVGAVGAEGARAITLED